VSGAPLSSRRMLFLCNDVVGQNMAGSGIRYWELARELSQYRGSGPVTNLDVTLAVLPFLPDPMLPDPISFPVHIQRCRDAADIRALAAETEVIVTQGILLATYPFLAELGVPLAFDFYIPFLLERLHLDTDTSAAQHLFTPISFFVRAKNSATIGWGRSRQRGVSTRIHMPRTRPCAN
jgi:hypothetical protein